MGIIRYALCCLALVISLAATTSIANANSKQTHLLALAACPPWKKIPDDAEKSKQMAESCQKDVDAIIPALQKTFAISPEHTSKRLNEEADFAGIEAAIKGLAARAKTSDRVVIYLNFHGGDVDAFYKNYRVKDEILAAYTKEEPKDFALATKNKKWMTVKYLRDLVDEIGAEEIILVVEACEGAAGMHDFRYDMMQRYEKGWHGREAVVFSSRANQAAAFNADGSKALFTDKLAQHLNSATYGNIRDLVEKVALDTHRSRRATCMNKDNRETFFDDHETYLEGCTQMPTVFDPYGLLDDIQIGGTSNDDHWHEMVALSKVDAMKKAEKKKAEATKKAEKAKQTSVAKSKSQENDEDPFAWTRPYFQQSSAKYR